MYKYVFVYVHTRVYLYRYRRLRYSNALSTDEADFCSLPLFNRIKWYTVNTHTYSLGHNLATTFRSIRVSLKLNIINSFIFKLYAIISKTNF